MTRLSILYPFLLLLCGCTALKFTAAHNPSGTITPGIGSTWKRPADGMLMVFVPAGEFTMGSAAGTVPSGDDTDEYPAHKVYLDAYWFDKTDVTNAMYARCVQTSACLPPWSNKSETRDSYYGNPNFDNYPVVSINWKQATTYCQWAGAQLPSEAQWEKAARGTDGRVYPWGNSKPTCSRANFGGKTGCVGDTSTVDSHPSGASPYGALDMAGNVWQWLADWYDGNYYATSPVNNPTGPVQAPAEDSMIRVLRGGSWLAKPEWIRSANRVNDELGNWSDLQGFRCARPAP